MKDFLDRYILNQDGSYKASIKSKGLFDRSEYEGQFNSDRRQGKGIVHFKNGEKYFGDWKNDSIEGIGVHLYTNAEIYSGEFTAGRRHGKGKYIFFNGN